MTTRVKAKIEAKAHTIALRVQGVEMSPTRNLVSDDGLWFLKVPKDLFPAEIGDTVFVLIGVTAFSMAEVPEVEGVTPKGLILPESVVSGKLEKPN